MSADATAPNLCSERYLSRSKSSLRLLHRNRQIQNEFERRSLMISKEADNARKTIECSRELAEEQLRCFRRPPLSRSIDVRDIRHSLTRRTAFTFSERNMFDHLTPAVMAARSTLRNRNNARAARQRRAAMSRLPHSETSNTNPQCYYHANVHKNRTVTTNVVVQPGIGHPDSTRSQIEPTQRNELQTSTFNEKVTVSQFCRKKLFECIGIETVKKTRYMNTKSVLFTEFCKKRVGLEKAAMLSNGGQRRSCPSTIHCRHQINQLIDHLNCLSIDVTFS